MIQVTDNNIDIPGKVNQLRNVDTQQRVVSVANHHICTSGPDKLFYDMIICHLFRLVFTCWKLRVSLYVLLGSEDDFSVALLAD